MTLADSDRALAIERDAETSTSHDFTADDTESRVDTLYATMGSMGSLGGQISELPRSSRFYTASIAPYLHESVTSLDNHDMGADDNAVVLRDSERPKHPELSSQPDPANSPTPPYSNAEQAIPGSRHEALLEMLAHALPPNHVPPPNYAPSPSHAAPPPSWRPRRRRRAVDGGAEMNGTGPRHRASSPATTRTTLMTDEIAASRSTLPPTYAEYGPHASRHRLPLPPPPAY